MVVCDSEWIPQSSCANIAFIRFLVRHVGSVLQRCSSRLTNCHGRDLFSFDAGFAEDSITNIISALLSPTCIPRMSLKAEIDNHTQYARDNQKHGRTQMHHLMEGNVRKGSKVQKKSLFSKSPCIHVAILGSTVTRGSVRCHDRKLPLHKASIRNLVKKALIAGRKRMVDIL
jgi:hypothetical protein